MGVFLDKNCAADSPERAERQAALLDRIPGTWLNAEYDSSNASVLSPSTDGDLRYAATVDYAEPTTS